MSGSDVAMWIAVAVVLVGDIFLGAAMRRWRTIAIAHELRLSVLRSRLYEDLAEARNRLLAGQSAPAVLEPLERAWKRVDDAGPDGKP